MLTVCVLLSALYVYNQSYDFFRFAIDWLIPVCVPVTEELLTTKEQQNKFKLTLDYMTSLCIDPLWVADSATNNKNYVKR